MNQSLAYYIHFCITKDYKSSNIDNLIEEDIQNYIDEFNAGWRVAPNNDGYISPQGKFIRVI
jgi:hypothetical protein